ncbi:hypothetical protein CDO73_01030 [Saccharibacillus sp. O23]|uniref:hypothetical protein n=1 Tax=Saccharibacillus sp. O23 TaxID=2009338 RepID=UPI000B4E41B1|nr:hypothetical protein [Saccharibacillus sp. O23]OWR33122.1 hypothetical protein CDO73_01030 [Saccharibacillus sp. O23]
MLNRKTVRPAVSRLLVWVPLIALCLMLSACAKGELDVKIKTDGTADIALNALVDDSALDTLRQSDLPEKIASGLRDQGFDAEATREGDQSGIRASRNVKLDADRKIPDIPGVTVESSADPGLFFTKRSFVVTADSPDLIPNQSSSISGYLGSLLLGGLVEKEFDFDFKLTLPIKPGENNADEVSADGRTLTWHLAATRENRIELALNVPNIRNIVYAASAVLLAAIALIVFLILRRKRKKKASEKKASAELPTKQA